MMVVHKTLRNDRNDPIYFRKKIKRERRQNMQTQSISLVTTAVSQNVSTKTTKANGDTFERFMSDHGTKVD